MSGVTRLSDAWPFDLCECGAVVPKGSDGCGRHDTLTVEAISFTEPATLLWSPTEEESDD